MRENPADRLVPVPAVGRVYGDTRRARLGDVTPDNRLRLDALARFLQDLSSDDTVDAAFDNDMAWVVRRTLIEVAQTAVFREQLDLRTFCSGIGSRWAERRVSVRGELGAVIEAATLWVHVDLATGRPVPLDEQFHDLFGPTAGGRQVSARLTLDAAPAPGERPDATVMPWPVRFVDLDLLGHVNNAASWALVEELLATRPELAGAPLRAELEYRDPIEPGAAIEVVAVDGDGQLVMWARDAVTGVTHLAGRVSSAG